VSKMSGDIVREALWRVTVWGAEHRAGQLRALADRARGRTHDSRAGSSR
jgi:dolichol-phosphate mannosyltransferase